MKFAEAMGIENINLRIGGVNEHFNTPWYFGRDHGYFKENNINLEWNICAGGTGEIINKLKDNQLDAAVLLTEGGIQSIVNGLDVKVVKIFVESPLIWGIHSSILNHRDLSIENKDLKIAISRFKSGSHLMAKVYAKASEVVLNEEQFVIVGDMDGARKSLKELNSDIFLWEKYTTAPLVDTHEFKRVGEIKTPWPSFLLVIKDKFIIEHPGIITKINNSINKSIEVLENNPEIIKLISNYVSLPEEQVKQWYKDLKWNKSAFCNPDEFKEILMKLSENGIISADSDDLPELLDKILVTELNPV